MFPRTLIVIIDKRLELHCRAVHSDLYEGNWSYNIICHNIQIVASRLYMYMLGFEYVTIMMMSWEFPNITFFVVRGDF